MATVHIPTPLRPYTDAQALVAVAGDTVGAVLANLFGRYERLAGHVRGKDGKMLPFVNVFLGDEDVRFLQQLETPVGADGQVFLIPSIAGGAR
jgi:molybdopterin converting factor small subunit